MPRIRGSRRTLIAGGAVAAAFAPTDITGLQLWLDAVDTTTLFQDAAKTTAAGNGDVVGAWADKSGNGRDATQATTSLKPLVDTDVLGSGYPGILFDNTDDWLSWTDFGLNAVTIYFLATGVDDGSDAHRPIDAQNNGADPYRLYIQYQHSSNNYALGARPNAVTTIGASDPAGRHLIIGTAVDGGNGTLYFDSATVVDGGPTAMATTWANDNTTDSRIGRSITDDNPFNGYIHSLLVYNTVHDATERGQVSTYLAARYGVTLS